MWEKKRKKEKEGERKQEIYITGSRKNENWRADNFEVECPSKN